MLVGANAIYTNGAVGIGTQSPVPYADLTVMGGIRGEPYYVDNTAFITAPAPDMIGLWTANSERLRIDDSGRVGINKASPVWALDVNGDINALSHFVLSSAAQISHNGIINGVVFEAPLVGGSVRMVIKDTGNVGIATSSPAYTLDVNGLAHRFDNSSSWTISSDVRLKHHVAPIKSALARLLSLRGVTFEWNDAEKHGGRSGTQIGMIAQEAERVFPDWVATDADGFKTLTYRGFEALAVESIRELQLDNERLRGTNETLSRTIVAQSEQVRRVVAENKALSDRLLAIEKRLGMMSGVKRAAKE